MRTLVLRFLIGLAPVMSFVQPVFADGDKKPGTGGGAFSNPMIMMMLFMFVIIWFLMIRPEQKKQKERQKMLKAIKKGDKVMTSAGILGTINNVKDTSFMVRIGDNNMVVEFAKSAVTAVLNSDGSDKAPEKDEKEKK